MLTGAASFGAVTTSVSAAREAASGAHVASPAAQAQVAGAQARAAAATTLLTGSSASSSAPSTSIDALVTASERLADAGKGTPDQTTFATISGAQQALPPYAAAISAAATAAGSGTTPTTAANTVRAGDEALTAATTPLQGLVTEQLSKVSDAKSLSTLAAALPIVVGGAATMFLVTSMFWLARKTHRLVNAPLLVGTLIVAGTTAFSTAATLQSANVVNAASTSADSVAAHGVLLASAHEARAAELQSVLPGTSTQAQAASALAKTADARVGSLLSASELAGGGAPQAWADYQSAQQQALATVGSDRAKAATTATTTAATAFNAFVKQVPATGATMQNDTTAPDAADIWPWLALLAGLSGGALAWVGLDRRLKDYR
ncbi:MAG: hypothetical protein Q4P32_08535 [Micrococcales bacterium]|nr:hypothetical protein [Micrococcales bacterium]